MYLNTRYEGKTTFSIPMFEGQYNDLVIQLLAKALRTPQLSGTGLQREFLEIVGNISPFAKRLSIQSVGELMLLITVYTAPGVLLQGPTHSFAGIKQLLSALVSMLTYNLSENPQLVLALLGQSKRLIKFSGGKLADMALPSDMHWSPTEQWYEEEVSQLALKPLLAIIGHVSASIERAHVSGEETAALVEVVKRSSLVGVIDEVGKFEFARFDRYQPEVEAWIDRYLWQSIFAVQQGLDMFMVERVLYVQPYSGGNQVQVRTQPRKEEPKRVQDESSMFELRDSATMKPSAGDKK